MNQQAERTVTIYRGDKTIQLTPAEFQAMSEAIALERERTTKLVAHYRTKGGRYEIKAWGYTFEGEQAFDYQDFTNGQSRGSGGGCMTPEAFAMELARKLHFAKLYDGINYRAVVAYEAADKLLGGVV